MTAGIVVARTVPGGGGNGAMPVAELFSLAAAAAAADAYLSGSPGARVGTGAGFIDVLVVILGTLGCGVCNVARAGNGDLNAFEGLRAAVVEGSDMEVDLGFPMIGAEFRPSGASAGSSWIDWAS